MLLISLPVIKQFLISKAVKSHKTKLNKLHHFKAVNKINNMWLKNNRGWCIYEEDLWAWSYARSVWIISSQLLTTGLSSLAVTYVEKQLSRFEPPSLSDGVTKPLRPQSKSQKRGCLVVNFFLEANFSKISVPFDFVPEFPDCCLSFMSLCHQASIIFGGKVEDKDGVRLYALAYSFHSFDTINNSTSPREDY